MSEKFMIRMIIHVICVKRNHLIKSLLNDMNEKFMNEKVLEEWYLETCNLEWILNLPEFSKDDSSTGIGLLFVTYITM